MPNTETVRALVSAFNVNNHFSNTVETNFTLQSEGKKNYIVVSFDKGMKDYQCSEYLYGIKRKIVREFYGIEEGDTDEVVLNTANLIFDVESFPFNNYKGSWSVGKHGGFEFVAPIDQGVIFNLKSHLASSLVKDVLEDMPTCSIVTNSFNKGKYLCHSKFPNEELRKQFERKFLLRMGERYENVPKKPLKVEGNSVYIKDVFDDARFIDSITRYFTWLEGMHLEVNSSTNHRVKLFKDMIIESIGESTGVTIYGFMCASPLNRKEASILIPIMQDCRGARFLTKEEARDINHAFNNVVLDDVSDKVQAEISVNGSSAIYGIDFSNPEISHCVITKIMESSVINKDHELAIDPELVRALSPAQSPVRVPNGPSSYLTESLSPTREFPTRSHGKELEGSPRRGLEKKEGLLHNPVNLAGPSKGFLPSPQLNSIAVSYGVSGPSSSLQSVGAVQDVQAGTSAWSQQPNRWSLPASSAEPSLLQPSGPSSWKGANESGSAWTSQPIGFWSSQSTSGNQWMQSQQLTEPGPSCSFWQKPSQVSSFMVNESSSSGCKISNELPPSNKLNNKEKELIEKLLYTLNLMNYTLGGVYTNFFAKDGKIVSLLHDNVNREKYFQAVRNYIIKECYGDEKEASKVCDLDEFPFKLNCEEKQEKTVVANISSGALSNLKILFSQKFGKNVDAIDISAVKKVEKREKDEWVDRQLFNKDSLEEACEDCFPDEEAMKIIPIAFEEGEYVLDRSRDTCEVKLLLREQLRRFRDTSVAGKGESGDKPLTKEEKELFKVLLYAFNYSNNNFDLPDTNFIVKNGKIASLIDDSVNVKEYLQKVRDETREEYCKDKKEAYDLDEFPFKFLSNCEKNQETTVVANISRGALLNLEKLFIYGYEEKVKIEKVDINIVKEAVKSKKHRLVERKAKEGIERKAGYHSRIKPYEAATASYPDESTLEDIPIEKYEVRYHLKRTHENWETELFVKDLGYTEDRSKAEKMKSEDNKDSGYSSGFVTDAENVSSKAEATTSGYESMDCENTRGGSPKRTLGLSMGMEGLAISTDLDATKVEQHSPIKKFRSN